MLKLVSVRHMLLGSAIPLGLLGAVTVLGLARPSSWPTRPTVAWTSQDKIPEATKPCAADEAKWWQEVRMSGAEALEAFLRKDEAVRKRSMEKYGYLMSDAVLSEEELANLNADIVASKEKFIGLLRHGNEKQYRAPVPDMRQMILYCDVKPNYTEEARRKKVEGSVLLRLEFRRDGTIGEVNVIRGLGYGLDEQASESVRQILFLPRIKDAVFVTFRTVLTVEFNLR